ncbi:MAG: ROK family protein [Chloroflexales bacterium]|nr:ROK family protein [Chloroflexales bacterium]
MTQVLGLDIGGSGIKGAIVDVMAGTLVTPRHRIPTPTPATPEAVVETAAIVVRHFGWQGLIGCGFPAVIKGGIVHTAANISPRWVGANGQHMLEQATGSPVLLLNDADVAGIAEMRLGAGRGRDGLVLMLTVGTGIGTALFLDGKLVPNTELGHIEIRGRDAERRASDGARERKGWSYAEWAPRFDEYLQRISDLLWPDLIIIGGGASRDFEKFARFLTVRVEVEPAQLRNEAGIIGAALAAHEYTPVPA